uniref:Uncharacterized protein n=1 Tax=viral metagenome TaxID=1070528 RepID=A0A6M3LDV6_9ZZZZ
MARIRYLKPDFFKDEDLVEHPHWIRLLFQGLWTIADKEGRLEDRPARIKVDIFPYENTDIEKGLTELAKIKNHSQRPFIQRYEVAGERYIAIVNWHKHQKPHHTEKDSLIPEPPPLNLKGMEKGMGSVHQASRELRNGEITVKKPLSFSFEEIYLKYPSKVGKKRAEVHFKASVKTEQDWQDIQIALKNYLKSDTVTKGFIQNASTWFNDWRAWVNQKGKIEPYKPKEWTPPPVSDQDQKEVREMIKKTVHKATPNCEVR